MDSGIRWSHISKEPKEAAAQTHALKLPKTLAGARVYYTDGSQGRVNGVIQGSAAYCQLSSSATVATVGSWNLGSRVEVADAEVFAVAKVLEAVTYDASTEHTIVIFIDSQAAIQRIQSPRGNCWAQRIYAAAHALRGRVAVKIQWCPGHCGIYGNEVVDGLAKRALEKAPCSEAYTSIGHNKRLARARALD